MDACGRTCSFHVESAPTRVLDLLQVCSMMIHSCNSIFFLFVLASPEVLQSFEIADSLRSPFLVLSQFVDSTLDLLFLVVHALGHEDGIHHTILRTLGREHGANARFEILKAVFTSEDDTLRSGGHCGS